jgi:hypothetical protein
MIIARLLALILGAALAVPALVLAQAYPSRPIELIIPFAPGGPTDIAIRLIQPQLSANLGVPVVLVNKAGGGGAIGMDQVAKAKARRLYAGRDGAVDHHHPAGHAGRRVLQAGGLHSRSGPMPSTPAWSSSSATRRGRRWKSSSTTRERTRAS